jgi:hypothetical protein
MSARRPEELLEPVDVVRQLRKLELSLGQVCRVAGVSKMQLDYWTTKAPADPPPWTSGDTGVEARRLVTADAANHSHRSSSA